MESPRKPQETKMCVCVCVIIQNNILFYLLIYAVWCFMNISISEVLPILQ